MTTQRFKELDEKYGNDPMLLCFNYFREEKNSNISYSDFQSMFQMWIMMMQPFSTPLIVMGQLVQWMRNKHK